MDEPLVDYGDSFEIAWGNIGEAPRWPKEVTIRLFRRNERGERLIVEERRYTRLDEPAATFQRIADEARANAEQLRRGPK